MATKNYKGAKFNPGKYDNALDSNSDNHYSKTIAKNWDQAQDNLGRYQEEFDYRYGLSSKAPRARKDTREDLFQSTFDNSKYGIPTTSLDVKANIPDVPTKSGLEAYKEKMNKARGDKLPSFLKPLYDKVLDPVAYGIDKTLYGNPLTQRTMVKAGETLAGKGSMMDYDGTKLEAKNAGKIGNFVADSAGTLLGMKSLPIGNGNLLDLTDKAGVKASEFAAKKLPSTLNPTLSKVLPSMARGAVDNGLGDMAFSVRDGKSLGDTLKTGGASALGGALLFGAGKGIGEGISNLKGIKKVPELPKVTGEIATKPKITDIKHLSPLNPEPKLENIMPEIKEANMSVTPSKKPSLPQFEKVNNEVATTGNVTGPQQKVSEFKTNTMRNSPMLDTKETQRVIDDIHATYNVKPNEQSLKRAMADLETNPSEVVDRIRKSEQLTGAEDTVAAGVITKQLRETAEKSGDYTELKSWLEELQPKVTETAQSLQALSTWKKLTPEGALMKAQQVVGKAQRAIADTNPKVLDEANKLADNVKNTLDDIDRGAVNEVVKELNPEMLLADKIKGQIAEGSTKKLDVEKQMVNTLFNVAKKTLPPKEINQMDPMTLVTLAMKNRDQYHNVWNTTKDILKTQFKDDPEKLSLLDDYLSQRLRPVFYENNLNKAIASKLKDMNINLGDVVRQHYSVNSKVRTDLTESLVNGAGLTGEEADYLSKYINNRMKDLTKAKKEQILSQMFKDRPTPQQKTLIQKTLEFSNLGGFSNSHYKDLAYEKLGIPTLTNDDIGFINNTMKKVETMEDGRAKDIEFAKVKQLIADKIPPALSEKVASLQRISLLLNTKTMTRNVLGNVIMGGLENIKDIPGALIDKGLSKTNRFKGERTTLMPTPVSLKTQLQGGVKGFKETLEDFKLGINTSPSSGQYDLPSSKAFRKGPLSKLESATNLGLTLGDRPFWQGAYDETLRQQMKIKGTTEPTEEMIEMAKKVADERTFQNVNDLVTSFRKIQEGLNLNKKFGGGNFIMPFVKTPANILDKAVDYTPIGGVNGLRKLVTGKGTQKEIVDNLSRSLTGSTLIAAGYMLAQNGLLTGQSNKDKDVASLEKQVGKSPYSIKVKDKYETIDWAQPAAIPLMIGADIFHEGKNQSSLNSTIIDAIKSGGSTLFDQSLLQGVSKLFGGYSQSGGKNLMEGLGNAAMQIPGQFVPSALKQGAQLLDNKVRDTYSPSVIDSQVNRIKAKVPGLSSTLQPKLDTMGREVNQFGGSKGAKYGFDVLFNPGYSNKYQPSDVEKYILDLYDNSGQTIHFPRVAKGYIDYATGKGKKDRINLTSQEKMELQKYIGEKTAGTFKNKIPSLKTKSPQDQAKELQKVLTEIYNNGEEYILNKRGIKEYKGR